MPPGPVGFEAVPTSDLATPAPFSPEGDGEQLWAAIATPWLVMGQLADLADRRHQDRLAAGLRWLARHRKFPVRAGRATTAAAWVWRTFPGHRRDHAHWKMEHLGSDYLPVRIRDMAELAWAIEHAAIAVGEFLERFPECPACKGTGQVLAQHGKHGVICDDCGGACFRHGIPKPSSNNLDDPYE